MLECIGKTSFYRFWLSSRSTILIFVNEIQRR